MQMLVFPWHDLFLLRWHINKRLHISVYTDNIHVFFHKRNGLCAFFAVYGSIKWFQQVNDYHWPLTCVMCHFFLHCHLLRKTDYISLLANKMRNSREIIISHVQHQIHMLQAFGWRLKLFASQNAKTINVLNTFGSWLISLPPPNVWFPLVSDQVTREKPSHDWMAEDCIYAIHVAAKQGDALMVKMLLESGANPESPGPRGQTPLEIAMDTWPPFSKRWNVDSKWLTICLTWSLW